MPAANRELIAGGETWPRRISEKGFGDDMASVFGFIQGIISTAFGLTIVGGLLWFIYKRHAADWERLAAVYGRPWREPLEQRTLQNLLTYGPDKPIRAYKGLVTIGLYEDGVGIRPNRFLAPFHDPVFIPYTDIKGWKQKWFIDAPSMELEFAGLPDMWMIMPERQAKWIASGASGQMQMNDFDRPPHGRWPYFTFYAAIFIGLNALLVIAYLLFPETVRDLIGAPPLEPPPQ